MFALATDRVGNAEAPKTTAELTFVAGRRRRGRVRFAADALALASPYPNPTRGPVVLQVGVPQAGPVRVTVYDVQGREVAVVLDGPRPPGWQPVRWSAGGLAAGVYVVRATTASATVTRTVTVVR